MMSNVPACWYDNGFPNLTPEPLREAMACKVSRGGEAAVSLLLRFVHCPAAESAWPRTLLNLYFSLKITDSPSCGICFRGNSTTAFFLSWVHPEGLKESSVLLGA